MNLTSIKIEKPEEINFILGQSHFIKTVEDIHEALVTLRDDGEPELIRRPPIERYAFFGERFDPPLDDLFAGLD